MVPAVPNPKTGSKYARGEMAPAAIVARPPATISDERTPGQLLAHVLKNSSQLQVGLSKSAWEIGLVRH